ncbi:kinesin-like protein KIF15-A isoform X1 [Megalobrama amblycephala]|uniref:kinesin-like protein KIF15-A isoform X1 n=1 Tax=Megalobrama amblycephala TaxID=75352 RepID=UPI0020142FC9|nr:kinesin-like protein KIF15-A isoform X1 [Megalobrama amblycephala]
MNLKGKATTESNTNSDGDAIKVFVRVRPLTQGTGLTTDGDHSLCLTVTSPHTVRLHCKPEPRTFTYDHVADMNTSQEEVFSSVAKNIVESCMNGYNGTIFAYGQTGSGKTFTMLGPSELDNFSDELRGVIPRSFEYLFFLINREVERSGGMKSFLCKCSFIEIYNEQIYDLLDSVSTSLFLREDIKRGVFVEGAVEKYAASAAEAYQVLSMGWRNRRVASTSMNRESSRSHAVFTMTLESKETGQEVVNIRTSQLNLVDLAGSERQKDTHAEGSRLKEASSINRSLMCLGQVIMALMDVSNGKNRHICYRDSKLTFLLRDSLGGNAKTYIIANVHPGSKCFGETLSTLHFAQRAKLIKNKAMVNEDTQGNVRQLQAEVKKLKEQLANALSQARTVEITPTDQQTADSDPEVSYKTQFIQAMSFWKKGQEEKKALQQKMSQLEAAWAQKEKFIQSNRMILKFRDDHIAQLKKELQTGQRSDAEQQSKELQEEIRLLRDQLEHHPRMMRYAAENCALREEIRALRALDSVRSAIETSVQSRTALEQTFLQLLEAQRTEETTGAPPIYSTPVTMETLSSVSMERMKVQLLQKQSELTATIQAFEEFKEVNKKQVAELESEKRYLEKSNKHLEKILDATKAHSKMEVCQLNKIHAETIKILTTPTKGYNLRNRLVPLCSPDHLNGQAEDIDVDDIQNEPPPPEMNELACEALTEELKQMQEQALRVQGQLDEEEAKNRKLLQQISKLEEQVTIGTEKSSRTEEMFSVERHSLLEKQDHLQEKIQTLEQQLEDKKREMDVLREEVRDLRVVLQSSDKELESTRTELQQQKAEHESETTQLSKSLISTQLQLDTVKLEWEQVLEKQRVLQDTYDTLQAEFQFELDQHTQQMELKSRECSEMQTKINELLHTLQEEKEQNKTVRSQLTAHQESVSKELVQSVEENSSLKKRITDLTNKNQQQCDEISALQQSVCSANTTINSLKQKIEQDKDVVLEFMQETRDLRSEVAERDQTVCLLRGEISDITGKYSTVCTEKEQMKENITQMQNELQELREASERRLASDRVELELLQEDLSYATDEVERLSKVVEEQAALLESSRTLNTEKENKINTLDEQVKQLNDQINLLRVRESVNQPPDAATPKGKIQTPQTPCGFGSSLSQVLECQERELESRRSSMITMEVLLQELNAERTAKNQEIDRLKAQLNEKEIVRMEIQTLLDKFYTAQNRQQQSSCAHEDVMEATHISVLRELQEERKVKSSLMMQLTDAQTALQHKEVTLAQSQTCVQELTTELRNRCLELRELRQKEHQQEKLQQEIEVLRKQVDHLAEENGKLLGHQNPKQKIEYLVKLKKEMTKLQEENSKLKQSLHIEESPPTGQ